MSRFDVVGFGALNVDKLFRVNRIAAAEEESFVIDFEEACGGSAANTVVGLARLGCKTGFIGKVARDREGQMLIEAFHKEGVDTIGIARARHGRSGSVLGFVDEQGQRALYVDPGVNDSIENDDMTKNYSADTKMLHLTSFVGERSLQAQKKLIDKLPQDVKVSFDPGALYAERGSRELETILERTFVLMPSARELGLLTGIHDYEDGAKAMLRRGITIVAVKLGSKGCYVTDAEQCQHVKPYKTEIVDTTGAGDAFNAGFLYGLLSNKSIYDCGRIGNFVASRCIMKMGARTGLPRIEELIKHQLAHA